jgi:uncharacterized protein
MIKNPSRREVKILEIEVRNGSVFITGYVNCTGKESHFIPSPKGRFREVVTEGTWKRALKRARDEVVLLFNHQESRKLASLKSGNMELQEDAIGLKIRCELNDSEIVEKANRKGFLHGWSFGFEQISSRWERTKEGYERRYLDDMKLYEISLLGGISKPAYPATSIVEIRNNDENILLERRYSDFEIKESILDFSSYERQIKLLKLKGMF